LFSRFLKHVVGFDAENAGGRDVKTRVSQFGLNRAARWSERVG
jgi:hypothetical protein